MPAFYDMTAANALLREYYDERTVENMVYRTNTALALVPKMTDFGGKYLPIPIITGSSQGRSATFTNAQGNQSAPTAEAFLLTSKSDYSIATIDNRTMLSSRTDKMAFLNGSKVHIDGAIRSATNSLASGMYRSGTGSIGRISGISSGVITLLSLADVVQFERNMVLQANSSDGGTPRAALGYVIAVDRTAGTVTVSATGISGSAGSPSGWTTNDYLLVQGDNNAKISGFQAWLPATAPGGSDSFYGVNRSVDPVRLAGVRYDGSAQTVEEALIDGSMLLGREGGVPDHAFCTYATYGALNKALGAKVQYVDLESEAKISFRGIRIYGAHSEIKVMPDRNCTTTQVFMMQWDTWRLDSLNEAPHISRYADGLEMLRVYNQDGSEVRVCMYGNLECKAPGWNAVVTTGV